MQGLHRVDEKRQLPKAYILMPPTIGACVTLRKARGGIKLRGKSKKILLKAEIKVNLKIGETNLKVCLRPWTNLGEVVT
jgi:hypothetical protein